MKVFILLGVLFSSAAFAQNHPTIVISIDGFAGKYLSEYKPSFLMKMASKGVYTDAMIPVYPTKTFPNHVSMVTGKVPNEHGILHNKFFNRKICKVYKLGGGNDDSRWLTAEPIWTIAEKKGIKTGVYFWPESETKVDGVLPSRVMPYVHNTPNKERLYEIIRWLKLPLEQRPKLLFTYFSTLDSNSHHHGTSSSEIGKTIAELDKMLHEFTEEIAQQTDMTPNYVIVSDHGMVDISKGKIINISELLQNQKQLNVISGQTQLFVYENDKNKLNDARSHLLNHPLKNYFTLYEQSTFPKHWHLDKNTDVKPDLILEAKYPATFEFSDNHVVKATHGYDPKLNADLNAMMIAFGPNIREGVKLSELQITYVFNIISTLIGVAQDTDDMNTNDLIFK